MHFSRIYREVLDNKNCWKVEGFLHLCLLNCTNSHTIYVSHLSSTIATIYISSSLLHMDHGLHLLSSNFFQNKNSLLEARLLDFGYSKRRWNISSFRSHFNAHVINNTRALESPWNLPDVLSPSFPNDIQAVRVSETHSQTSHDTLQRQRPD